MKLHKTLFSAAFAIASSAGLATAQCSTQTLSPAALTAEDNYGSAVAAKGNFAVVGAPQDTNARGTSAGIAYIHTKTGNSWSNSPQVILPADTSTDSKFGQAVAIDTYVAIGADNGPFSGSAGTGAVYVYANSGGTWSLQKKITAPDAAAGDMFGRKVATMGDWIAIGAAGDDSNGHTNNGAVYLYKRSGTDWLFQAKLAFLADDGGSLGWALSMADGYLAIGTAADSGVIGAAGSVYVYKLVNNTSWVLNDFLSPPLPQDNGRYGATVALHGSTLAVGAYLSDVPGGISSDGGVYMYTLQNGHFGLTQTLPGDWYTGRSIALNNDTMVVGNWQVGSYYTTHLFHRNGSLWQHAGTWNERHMSNGFCDMDLAVTDTEILQGLGAMDTAAVNAGLVQIIPTTVEFAPDQFDFRGAIGMGSVSSCTSLATPDGTTSCGTSNSSPDVWYEFLPANTARYSFDTIGSDFDTVLSLHQAIAGGQNSSLACNDDFAPPNRASRIVYKVAAGQRVVARVAGYNGATGQFTLNIHEICPADFNGDGTVDFFDYLDFVDAFSISDSSADFNSDHVFDFFDYLDYVDAFSSGC